MEPQTKKKKKIAKEYKDLGLSVPDNVSKGLTATYMLQAMTGNTEAIAKLVGSTIGQSPEFSKMLQTAKNSGEDIPEAILTGVGLKMPDANTSVEDLIASIDTTLSSQTVDVAKTAKSSGKSIGDELAEGMDSKQKKVNTSGKNLADESKAGFKGGLGIKGEGSSDFKLFANYCAGSFTTGLGNKESSVKKAGKDIGSSAKTGVKEELSITNGQSSDFKTYGEQTMKGFVAGINAKFGDVSSAVKEAMKKAKEAGKTELDIHSPSRAFRKFGNQSMEGYDVGVDESSENTINTIKKWASKVKSSAEGLTVNPLTFQSSYKVNTKGLEGYQDLVSGNVSVGGKIDNNVKNAIELSNIEDKIKSAVRDVLDEAIKKLPQRDIVMLADGNEMARTVNKHNSLNNQRFSTAAFQG